MVQIIHQVLNLIDEKIDMNIRIFPSFAALILLNSQSVFADKTGIFTQPLPDTQKFRCKYCPTHIEAINVAESGVAIITGNNSKFSEYSGYNGKSFSVFVDGYFESTDEKHKFLFSTTNLGSNIGEVNLSATDFGRYQLNITYDQLLRYQSESNRSIYLGVSSDTLKRPTVNNSNTIRNTEDIINSYGSGLIYNTKQERSRFSVAIKKVFSTRWQGRSSYQYENKTGLKTFGGGFNANYISALSVIIPEPIDYVTQLLNLSVGYYGNSFKIETGVKASLFKNSNNKLSWDNLYINNDIDESTTGQSALAPDNHNYQLYALGQIRPFSWVTGKGQISIGRMKQNQDFLPYTVNENLNNIDLPKASLNGGIDTLTANFRVSVKPIRRLEIYANANVDRKDNKTPTTIYRYVALDTSDNKTNSRSNLAYGYRYYSASLATIYRYRKSSYFNFGYKYQRKSRSYSEIPLTKTKAVWGKVKHRLSLNTAFSLKLVKTNRDASDFTLISQIRPAQNSLMRKYYLADKKGKKASLNLSTFLMDRLSLDISMLIAKDDYYQSIYGVTEANDFSYEIDLLNQVTESISTSLFYYQERIESKQAGIDFNFQNWQVINKDSFTTVGLSVDWDKITSNLDIGSTLVYANSSGEISPQRNGIPQSAFPDLTTSRTTLTFYAAYRMKENLKIKAQYMLEKYSVADWHYDGLDAASLDRVLGTQQTVNDYLVHLFVVSGSYAF